MNLETTTMEQAMLLEGGKGASRWAQWILDCFAALTQTLSRKEIPVPVLIWVPTSVFCSLPSTTDLDIIKCYFFSLKRTCSGPPCGASPPPTFGPPAFALSPLGFFSSFFFFFFYCWIYKILWNMLFPDVGPKCLVIYFPSKQWADEITQVGLHESTLQRLH